MGGANGTAVMVANNFLTFLKRRRSFKTLRASKALELSHLQVQI